MCELLALSSSQPARLTSRGSRSDSLRHGHATVVTAVVDSLADPSVAELGAMALALGVSTDLQRGFTAAVTASRFARDGPNELRAVTQRSATAWHGLFAGTVPLDATQWLVCIGMASLVLWLGGIRKMVHCAWIKHVRNGADTPSPTPA